MESEDKTKKIGKAFGFLVMFFLFTTFFYLVLKLTDRLPEGWNYLYVLPLTLFVTLIGVLVRLSLK